MQESFALTADWMLPETLLSSIIIKYLSNLNYQTHRLQWGGGYYIDKRYRKKTSKELTMKLCQQIITSLFFFFFSIYDRYFQCLLFSIYLEIHLALKASSSVLYINDYLLSTSLSKHHYRHDHFKKSIPMEIDVVNLRRN